MRASDQKLYAALDNAGLDDLAQRAADGEWNQYFGEHGFPQQHLTAEIQQKFFGTIAEAYAGKGDPDQALVKRANLINSVTVRVMAGEFDATKDETDEWTASDEGQAALAEAGLTLAPDGAGGTQVVPAEQLKEQAEGDASEEE